MQDSVNVIHHINKIKEKNYMVISIDVKKNLSNSTPIHNKTSSKLEGNLFKLITIICNKHTAIILRVKY